jgi:hypothetical protein
LGTSLPMEYGYVIVAASVISLVALAAVTLRKWYRPSSSTSAKAAVLQKIG